MVVQRMLISAVPVFGLSPSTEIVLYNRKWNCNSHINLEKVFFVMYHIWSTLLKRLAEVFGSSIVLEECKNCRCHIPAQYNFNSHW